MAANARQTSRVNRSFDMVRLRGVASLAQVWRRRLSTSDGPRAWVEFRSIFGDEIVEERRAIANRIRAIRRSGGVA